MCYNLVKGDTMDKGFSFEDVDDLMSEEDLKELDTVSDDKIISEYKDSVDFNNQKENIQNDKF